MVRWFFLAAILAANPVFAQKPSRFVRTTPKATVAGRITVHQTVGRTFGEYPVAKLSLYLVRVEDAREFQELQRKCRKATGQMSLDPSEAFEVCEQSMARAARLIPQLSATAAGQTDRDGYYKFENVPSGGRYQVVGVKYEADEPILYVGVTPRLRAGEERTINISENAPWTNAIPPGK